MIEHAGRAYALPRRKTAVFCIDGWDPSYVDLSLERGTMPRLRRALDAGGTYVRGRGQVPSFTNPNNVCIVTGRPASVHGISGNHFYDRAADVEVPMDEPRWLRVPTLLEALERAGVRTLAVTAKDKLRMLLGAARAGGPAPIALSAERAHEQRVAGTALRSAADAVGRAPPDVYDPELSLYAMEMGLALHERVGAQVLFVSLTDYVQHKEAPGSSASDAFHARIDALLGDYFDEGFACVVTADHGMNDKTRPDGSPNVVYLEDVLAAGGVRSARVLLPITDPYVVHHGALGSFAAVSAEPDAIPRAAAAMREVPGVELVLARGEAASRFDLPEDRIGDLVVLGDRATVLGKSEARHDLSAVRRGLRSHGGVHEAVVPVIACQPLRPGAAARIGARPGALGAPARVTNADAFDLALNGLAV